MFPTSPELGDLVIIENNELFVYDGLWRLLGGRFIASKKFNLVCRYLLDGFTSGVSVEAFLHDLTQIFGENLSSMEEIFVKNCTIAYKNISDKV